MKERLKKVGRGVAKVTGTTLGTVATLAFASFAVYHHVNH